MRKTVWLCGFLAAAASASLAAAAPRVVSCTPADGAKDVPVDLGKIAIVFDVPMAQDSWTILEVPGTAFPPLPTAAKPWADAKTFVQPMGPLAPHTTYAFQLNGPRWQGFVATDGKPLPAMKITFTTGETPPAKADCRIVNVADDFLAYYEQAKDLDAAARAAKWDALLEAKHPAFFAHVIYRKKQGADREHYKKDCIRRFWAEMVPKLPAIRKANTGIASRVRAVLAGFAKQFPDFQPPAEFYVTISFGFRGKVVDMETRNVPALGLENLQAEGPQIDTTTAHELLHLYHFQTFSPSGGLYRTLWAEGLAAYSSAVVVPGHRMSDYLEFPAEKMNRCQKLLPVMAKELRENMSSTDQRIKRIYFGAEPNNTQIPPEAGYYVGFLIVQRLAASPGAPGPAKLARMKADDVYRVLDRELARLAATP